MKNNAIYGLMACSLIAFISYNAVRTETEIEVHTVEIEKVVEKIVYKDHRVDVLESKYPEVTDYHYGNWSQTADMTFKEAFRFYRDKYPPGTIFMWQGKYYHTYYKEEV